MLYLWPQTSSMKGMSSAFGVMTRASDKTVPQGIREGRLWAMDNECFTREFRWQRWQRHFDGLTPYLRHCLFVVVPDIVADAQATWRSWQKWAPIFRRHLNQYDPISWYPRPYRLLAYVAQDGAEDMPLPEDADWIFIGGSTAWKLSAAADEVMRRAFEERKFIHVGRVNSQKRIWYCKYLEVNSVDGTYPIYEPDTAERRLAAALNQPLLLTGQPYENPEQE